MTDTILVLAEDTLAPVDVEHLLALHEGEVLAYRVLVPADSDRPLLATVVDNLGLGAIAGDDNGFGREIGEGDVERLGFEAHGRRLGSDALKEDLERRLIGRVLRGAARGMEQEKRDQGREAQPVDRGAPRGRAARCLRHSSSSFASPCSALAAAMIFGCRCPGTSS